MNLPEQLKYTEDHEWLQLSDDGTTAKIGITDFAQGELGDIVFVELEAVWISAELRPELCRYRLRRSKPYLNFLFPFQQRSINIILPLKISLN